MVAIVSTVRRSAGRPGLRSGRTSGLAQVPDGAFGGVGDVDAALVELGADLVGAGPVAFLAGLRAVGDELLDVVAFRFGQVVRGAALVQVGGVEGGQAQAEQ